MRFCDRAYDAQPQATASLRASHALIDLIEPIEDTAGGTSREADAIVADRNFYIIAADVSS